MLTILVWVGVAGLATAYLFAGSGSTSKATADVALTTAVPTGPIVAKSKRPRPEDACEALKTLQAFGTFYAPDNKDLAALVAGFSPVVMKELVTPDTQPG